MAEIATGTDVSELSDYISASSNQFVMEGKVKPRPGVFPFK